MKVFNLTDKYIDYRGMVIRPYSNQNYPGLEFIPDRDRQLQTVGVLAFGSLPKGWSRPVSAAKKVVEIKEVSQPIVVVKTEAEPPKMAPPVAEPVVLDEASKYEIPKSMMLKSEALLDIDMGGTEDKGDKKKYKR